MYGCAYVCVYVKVTNVARCSHGQAYASTCA